MKGLIFSLIIIIYPGVLRAVEKTYTLDQAQNQALSSNPEIKALEEELEAANARRNRTRSAYYPKLGVETGFERFNSPTSTLEGNYTHAFLEYSFFNGGRDYFRVSAASAEEDQATIKYQKSKQSLAWDVERTFYRIIYSQEILKSYDDAVKRNQEQLKTALNRRRAGLISDADTYEFEIYGSILASEKSLQEAELIEAQGELRKLLGLDENVDIKPIGKLNHYHVKDSYQNLVARLPAENESILTGIKEIERAQAIKKSVRGNFLPSLSFKVTQGRREIEKNPNETAIWAIARWELFSGFETYWEMREANANQAKSEATLVASQNAARADLQKSFNILQTLQHRVDLEGKNKERARKYFDVVTSEYRRGVKNSPDLRGASEQLLETNLRDLKYRYEFFVQKVNVQKALGNEIKVILGSAEGHKD